MKSRLVPWLTAVLLSAILTLTGCGGDGDGCLVETVQFTGLGVDFAPWNGTEDSVAGDIKFSKLGTPPTPLLGVFGDAWEKGTVLSTNFFLDEAAVVVAPGTGTVTRFESQPEDYEIELNIGGCQVSFDHVLNPLVALGETVQAGAPIGNPGPWDPVKGIGVIELQVQLDNTFYCPIQFLTPEVSEAVKASMTQLMEDVESLAADTTLYREDDMVLPGCYLLVHQEPEARALRFPTGGIRFPE